jgi:non-heme Fe2+,alpha-ketoglutarate-dependent halogenase
MGSGSPAAQQRQQQSWAARELAFVPTPSLSTRVLLSAAELAAYNRDGFCLPAVRLLEPAEVAAHGDLWEALLAAEGQPDNGFSVNGAFKRHGQCFDLVAHPAVVQLARDVLGTQNVACWGAHYVCKLPRQDADPAYHQDGVLWPFSKTRNCSIWLALDDADLGNGCTQFFRGSHLLGGLHRLRHEGGDHTIQPANLARLREGCTLVPAAMRAGYASVHSDLTAHLSMGPNSSRRRRLGISISFCPMVHAMCTRLPRLTPRITYGQ